MKTDVVRSLEELINSGVLELGRGKVISKKDIASCPGAYPVYSSAKEDDGKFGEYGRYMFDEELITWSVDGGGRLFHRAKHRYSVTNVGGTLRILKADQLSYRYLYYVLSLLHSEIPFDWVLKAHPSTIKKLYKNIPVPPLAEQERMVRILDEAFEGIATVKANAEKNLENARSVFESYLQSVFSGSGAGWEQKRLSDIAMEFGRGKSKHRPRNDPKLYGGPYPFIQTGDISNADHWLTEYVQTYSELGLSQSKLWPKGTICIAIVGATVGETAILDFEACFPDSVIGIVVDSKLADIEYVEFLLQSFKTLLKEKGRGSARDNINLGTFEGQTFPFPNLKIQRKIVTTLNRLRSQTQALDDINRQKCVSLDELKQSLLREAFSGRL